MSEDDQDTYEAAKNYECEVIFQTRKGYGNAIVEGAILLK